MAACGTRPAIGVQELAAVLATLVAFLRVAGVRGGFAWRSRQTPSFSRPSPSAAAMRLLSFSRLAEIIDAPAVIAVHAETAWRTRTRIEPRTNVLRATIATVAAVAGGAELLTVLPFDAGTADSQRPARNTQLIAKVEAHLARVADPGAGAGAIEAITAGLATQAWALFQAIEAEGGITAAPAIERLTQAVMETRQQRARRAANGEVALVGVNVHAAEGANPGAEPFRRSWRPAPLRSPGRQHHPGRRGQGVSGLPDFTRIGGRCPGRARPRPSSPTTLRKVSRSSRVYGAANVALGLPYPETWPASPRISGSLPTMTLSARGRSASTPASRPRRIQTPSTAATSPAGRRACRSHSICPPTVDTTFDNPRIAGDVGMRGRHRLDLRHADPVRRHPAGKTSVSMTMNGAVLPIMALYIVARRRAGRARGGPRRNHTERHPQGVHGPQHVHLSAGPLASGSSPT